LLKKTHLQFGTLLPSSALHHIRFDLFDQGEHVMRFLARSTIAGLACAVLVVSSAQATIIYDGPSAAMATDQSFTLNFNSGASTSELSFILDGYGSLDGKNAYEDDFSLKLNDKQVFLGTFNLGGGSNSGSQANVYSNPFGASLSNPTNNGTGIGWNGGKETFTFAGLPLNVGLNTLTFSYLSLTGDHAGFQGLGDEGWGVEKVEASATPLPPTWTMMLIGLGGFGWLTSRRKKERAFAVA
jgi:hypothetical protein